MFSLLNHFRTCLLKLWHLADKNGWTSPPLAYGAWGEIWAERYLRLSGCRILGRNVRPCRHGEVDIIAEQGKTILFVEVKSRHTEAYGRPLGAIGRKKRRWMRRCANHWLAQQNLLGTDVLYRFDAIEIVGIPGEGVPKICWIRMLNMEDAPPPEY